MFVCANTSRNMYSVSLNYEAFLKASNKPTVVMAILMLNLEKDMETTILNKLVAFHKAQT